MNILDSVNMFYIRYKGILDNEKESKFVEFFI